MKDVEGLEGKVPPAIGTEEGKKSESAEFHGVSFFTTIQTG
jgi:hypothetical protein